MNGAISVMFRSAIVEVVYQKTETDIEWFFADDPLNDIVMTGAERSAIRDEVLKDARR